MSTTRIELDALALPPGSAATPVLADTVCDAGGQVLLATGSALTPDRIAGLRRRGITTVSVVDVAPDDDAADADRQRESARLRLHHLFRRRLRDGEINPLLHMLLRHRDAGA